MTPVGALRGLHLALGAVLGAQAIVWLVSGVALSWLPSDLVDGGGRAQTVIPAELDARSYASPGGAIAQTPGASEVILRHFLGRTVYLARGPAGPALFDARTGEKLSPLSDKMAREVARQDFVGAAEIASLDLLILPPPEFRGEAPVWRASFADERRTRLYISPSSGEVIARRNRYSSIHDFFRRLHMMDYGGDGSDSDAALKVFGGAALVYLLLGAGLLAARHKARSSKQ
ncbi:MAG: hypothetical protein VX640_09090 [Pseudomonadota bacterium]|nr:hypothetical protein [Pseudomonadota bacterium]